jgi:hypothetical protein
LNNQVQESPTYHHFMFYVCVAFAAGIAIGSVFTGIGAPFVSVALFVLALLGVVYAAGKVEARRIRRNAHASPLETLVLHAWHVGIVLVIVAGLVGASPWLTGTVVPFLLVCLQVGTLLALAALTVWAVRITRRQASHKPAVQEQQNTDELLPPQK